MALSTEIQEVTYNCDYCESCFSVAEDLKNHTKSEHSDICVECGN